MKLVSLVCLCLMTRCGITAAGGNGRKVVEEGSDVILPCSLSSKENIQSKLFDWTKDGQREDREVFLYAGGRHYNNGIPGQSEQFRGRVSHFEDQLKYGDASIIIRNTRVTDSGNYTCHLPQLQPRQIFHVELIVRRIDRSGENIPGASPKPYVAALHPTEDGVLVQCEVRGAFPEPRLQWKDSSGNNLIAEEPQVLERGGSYDIILNATVTKTGYYHCVATQETIRHQIHSSKIYVTVSGASPKPYVTILNQTEDGELLQCEVRGASPEPRLQWKDRSGNILPAEEPQVSEEGGNYVTLQVTVTETGYYHCVATQETIGHQINSSEIYVSVNGNRSEGNKGFSAGRIIGFVVVSVLFSVLVVIVLLAELRMKRRNSE